MKTAGDRISRLLDEAGGHPVEYDLAPYEALARRIRAVDLHDAADGDLKGRAQALRAGLSSRGEGEEDLVLAFALAAEAARRRLRLEPYDEQLVAGIAMYGGKLAEMQTGEGKTLAAVLPSCLHALAGRRMHVLTANDYLARRDAAWMGPVYDALGLNAAAIGEGAGKADRKAAYRADVLYITAREAGFDHLRDQLCYEPGDMVQGDLEAVLVDEADFLLIDEARIPLVLAGATDSDGLDVARVDRLARALRPGLDYGVDPEGRRVWILPEGHERIGREFGIEGIHEERGAPWFARMHAALHAHALLRRDVDYVVKGDRAELVDEFTGRVADRRRWPYGIQAALEAKEGLTVHPEGRLLASLTVRDYVGQYGRIAAMTATAVPSAVELHGSYGLATVVIPPARPVRRIDLPDLVFRSREAKTKALVAEIASVHRTGRPILVGTASVRESEGLAERLARSGVDCRVLNARNNEREAERIAAAGRLGAVTISTNMAGRGTDIRLAGPEAAADAVPEAADGTARDAARDAEYRRILELGGLYVIGTNRHESRRVDDQLRGRCGRQGEPGSSRFFISLEDPLFERYGIRAFLPRDADPGGEGPIMDRRVLREIDRAQRIIERQNHDIRRTLAKYTGVVELDRRYVRQLRMEALREGRLPAGIEALPAPAEHRGLLVQAFLGRLDEFWADHLRDVDDVKEGIGLVRYAGKEPGMVFLNRMADAFEKGLAGVEESVIRDYGRIRDGAAPAVLGSMGVKRPSSTWTYQVDDTGRESFRLSTIAGSNIGEAAVAAVVGWPIYLAKAVVDAVRAAVGGVGAKRRPPR